MCSKMNIKFVVNDYILIWSLLFEASISESIYQLKQKLWANYKIEYNNTYRDKSLIMKDPKNFIPNNDSIYNMLLESQEYELIQRETEKYRLEVMKVWDSHKKQISNAWCKIIKKEWQPYTVLIVTEALNIIDTTGADLENKILILGKKLDTKNPLKTLLYIILAIVKKELSNLPSQDQDIAQAIIELAVLNEFATELLKKSCYLTGDPALSTLKRQIYPYWLMYLGVPKTEMLNYMTRDKIAFNVDDYAYEKELKKMDIEEFIKFCIRNKKYILKRETLEII